MESPMEQRMDLKFCVELQKSPAGQTTIHGLEIEEFLQARKAADVKVQDTRRNNVDLPY
jgi:hypothetical protein